MHRLAGALFVPKMVRSKHWRELADRGLASHQDHFYHRPVPLVGSPDDRYPGVGTEWASKRYD